MGVSGSHSTEHSRPAILIADDHPLFRDALAQMVSEGFPEYRIIEADSHASAVSAVETADPDLVLLDLNMPGMGGFAGLLSLRDHAPATPIAVISADETVSVVRQALTCGASGFIPKSMPKACIVDAVRAILDGDTFVPFDLRESRPRAVADDPEFAGGYATLTPQQRKVLELMIDGKSNKVIAFNLSVTERTVKAHVSAILRKLGVSSRTQAVLSAAKMLRGN